MRTNPLTGEVAETLGGVEFRFRASLGALAALETGLDVRGLDEIREILLRRDNISAVQLRTSLRALCSSDNRAALDDILLLPHLDAALAAVLAAMIAGLPPAPAGEGHEAGNAVAPAGRKSRGRATGRSASAS